ncbi:MAG: hypothetical protein AAFY72_10485, partial [Cyanobacteria bacterium J06649_4]
MAFRVLKNGLFSILGIVIIGGFQHSTLIQLSSSEQDFPGQSHTSSARLESQQDLSTPVKQDIEQIRLMAKMPSLGFRNTWANYAFLQFLQYFGDEARRNIGYHDSAEYFSTVIYHDPYFVKFYVFLSGSSTLYAGMPEETVQIMSRGLDRFGKERPTDSYYI